MIFLPLVFITLAALSSNATSNIPHVSHRVNVPLAPSTVRMSEPININGVNYFLSNSAKVSIKDVDWMRVVFDEARTSVAQGDILRIVSHQDGNFQLFDARTLAQWKFGSAYFNGNSVNVEILCRIAPQARIAQTSAAVVVEVITSDPDVLPFGHTLPNGLEKRDLCGPEDRRVPSDYKKTARFQPMGCTAWVFDDAEHCLLSAAHCGVGDIVEFNVPPSQSDGEIVHPPPADQYVLDPESFQSTPGKYEAGRDWEYFGVFPNTNTGKTPFESYGESYELFRGDVSQIPVDTHIEIIGYGVDRQNKDRNQIQQVHQGPLQPFTSLTDGYPMVNYWVDTMGGNSGSAVQVVGNKVIAIHTNGGCAGGETNFGTSIQNQELQAALANPKGVCAGKSAAYRQARSVWL